MSLSRESLGALKNHWALNAIGKEELELAKEFVNQRLAHQALGNQITFSFSLGDEDNTLLERVCLAFEVAAMEGLQELSRPSGENMELRNQAVAASFSAFAIHRLLPVLVECLERLFFILRLSAIAYCGDRWPDLRRWYKENEAKIQSPNVEGVSWDRRLLYRIFVCWIQLFRKDGGDDLYQISRIIAELRRERKQFEEASLSNGSHESLLQNLQIERFFEFTGI